MTPDQEIKQHKRKKVSLACVFCRRSHMTCDEGRPCQRCIKRSIGHMCHDEPRSSTSKKNNDISSLPTSKNDGDKATQDQFYLIAADPHDGKVEDKLNEVINAKYEAGILKPYNYVNGYARLQRYMDQHMTPSSRQRILNVMGAFRPAFRDVAQALTDVDLILVEEAFERLLLDYDRVFTAMAVPACLWRRTGEIYKGNKEFADLINVPVEQLRDGRLCIYELMIEDSTVNYWEKYSNVAFDPCQKAVLTSCLIQPRSSKGAPLISCCFSFTIRRDKFNM
ncbi:potential fungal zinc cluster transcriptionfactor [Lichtheimia corymbifera JMRC:FSU:9682]|uniref:Potential fungal zinc cluster transcriptionfactor n=1 Tax=Lichtheimia corymbifera JMRC:FSU:9682 TaxID=1263082 RepID=A0A068SEA8_9FUNG|nr:potential fungal zinc cluster transcriptionfactor [Lichtheimia corymbifera JMRC:FSU:9682]